MTINIISKKKKEKKVIYFFVVVLKGKSKIVLLLTLCHLDRGSTGNDHHGTRIVYYKIPIRKRKT